MPAAARSRRMICAPARPDPSLNASKKPPVFMRVLGSLRFDGNELHTEALGAFGEGGQVAVPVDGVVIFRAAVRVGSAGSKRVIDTMGQLCSDGGDGLLRTGPAAKT